LKPLNIPSIYTGEGGGGTPLDLYQKGGRVVYPFLILKGKEMRGSWRKRRKWMRCKIGNIGKDGFLEFKQNMN